MKECCKHVDLFKCTGTMTKWPVHKQTHRTTQKHVAHQDATDISVLYIFMYNNNNTANS